MITTFRSTKYARPQFEYGLAPLAVWLSSTAVVVVAAVAVNTYVSNRALLAYSKAINADQAALHESMTAGLVSFETIKDAAWRGQTFTPAVAHTIGRIILRMSKNVASPAGSCTVSIRATAAGLPTGSDLVSTTISTSLIPVAPTAWVTFDFATPYSLAAGTVYAIVARSVGAGVELYLWCDDTAPIYAGGNLVRSANSGTTWTAAADTDLGFQDWHLAVTPYIDLATYVKGLLT